MALLAVAACGGSAASSPELRAADPPGEASVGGSGDAGPAEPVELTGWSIRDSTPYTRSGHSLILDDANDRLILFGGGAADVWALPLSGPHENQWQQLATLGEPAPPDTGVGLGYNQPAVYDRDGQRLLVLSSPAQGTATLYQLTLDDHPTWSRVETQGQHPGAEVDRASIVLDQTLRRLILVGPRGTWALGLDEAKKWTRLSDSPAAPLSGTAAIDRKRARLLFFPVALGPRSEVWQTSLTDGTWALIDELSCGSNGYNAVTYDPLGDQVVFAGRGCGVSSYELTGPSLRSRTTTNETMSFGPGALDSKRNRILYFSGGLLASSQNYGDLAGNGTAAVSLTSLRISAVLNSSLFGAPGLAAVWDNKRSAVVTFGASAPESRSKTLAHTLDAAGSWRTVEADHVAPSRAAYDPVSGCTVGFGSADFTPVEAERLCSGLAWEGLATRGPQMRGGHALVLDSAGRRLLIHGGVADPNYDNARILDDLWALSLDG